MMDRAERLRGERTPYVLATVVRVERPTSAKTGDRALVLPDGTMEGFVGGHCAEATVRDQALRLLDSGESTLLRITPGAESPPAGRAGGRPPATSTEGLVTVHNPCLSGGTLEVFLETVIPPALLHIYGDGPVARSLADVGRAAGFDVRPTGAADPPGPDAAAVVVATHGWDEEPILKAALDAGVPYIGLIASRKRGAAVAAALDRGDRVHTPAGLDIGARTAPEIAVSVLAEILSLRPARPVHPPAGAEPEAHHHCCE
ncbi:XdhC family protein [Actinomadura formosensis]|uniref:XdhC family protein n=1 Tax=Actinomadura formosensis TaxID=60706 RepID=UPI000A02868E|nr:XdhC family protein [Actinomadura formosensis]